jgi:hypothetical protein
MIVLALSRRVQQRRSGSPVVGHIAVWAPVHNGTEGGTAWVHLKGDGEKNEDDNCRLSDG